MQLHYGYGMKDFKVALIQVDITNTVITGDKTSNITNYHFIQIHNHMIMWHYFGIGIGIKQKCSSIMNIKTSAAKILKCFSDAESIQRTKEQFSKKQEGRTFNNILHCTTTECAETFDEPSKWAEHMLSGKQSIPEKPYKLLCDLLSFLPLSMAITLFFAYFHSTLFFLYINPFHAIGLLLYPLKTYQRP